MRLGFFGAGNMVSAIALGVFEKNKDIKMYFYTPSQTKASSLADRTNGILVKELADMPKDLDWYFLGFKPQSLADFNFDFNLGCKVVSLLASTTLESLHKKFRQDLKITRVMPNTPSMVFEGMNLLYFSTKVELHERKVLVDLFSGIGKVAILENEVEIDLLTPFSGSGPGIIFELALYLENALKKLNISNLDSKKIIAQTFYGTSKLMIESDLEFSILRDQVTSKKGVTEKAIESIRDSKIEVELEKAIKHAHNRIEEMKKGI